MLDIVIVADFCGSFDHRENNRFIYLAEQLAKKGHNVEIVTSDFSHGAKKTFNPIVAEYDAIKVTMLHEPPYKKNVSIKRFFSHYRWGKNVYKYLKARNKPDVVYCAIPTLKAASLTGKYCNRNGIRFIVDVQDLWPEAYKMVFNVPIISSIIFAPFKWIANTAYRRADEIVAVSQTYVDRAMKNNKKVKVGHSVFLGTNLETFDRNVVEAKPIKKESDDIWLGYCGTLGASYDLTIVFDAMRLLHNPSLKFVVMGDGPKRKTLEECSKGLNVLFTGCLPYKEMCGILSRCDIVVNPIMKGAAASIINKHADYVAAGRPVINTQESAEYRELIDARKMGINCKNGDVEELSVAIKRFCDSKELRETMGKNARKCAEELFDRCVTYKDIEALIETPLQN